MDDIRALREFLEESPSLVQVAMSRDGVVRTSNGAFCAIVGRRREDVTGVPFAEFLAAGDAEGFSLRLSGEAGGERRFLLNLVDAAGGVHTVECILMADRDPPLLLGEPVRESEEALRAELLEMNNRLAVLARESAKRSADLEKALEKLDRTYWHIKKIQEVLPICMECGMVKNESGWESVVDYLKKNSLFLSHGYCPDCIGRLRAEGAFGFKERRRRG